MKKKFEIPELTIIMFEGDLATGDPIVVSDPYGGQGDMGYDEIAFPELFK